MLDLAILSALMFGLVSAATLPLGAAIGIVWQPADRVMALMLAFGGGALIATLAIDLVAPSVTSGHYTELAFGAVVGGVVFKLLNAVVNRRGGYLRKPSTAMTYWRNQARKRLHQVLVHVRRTQPLGSLSPEAEEQMLSVMVIRHIQAGTYIHRAGDPSNNLYIIEDGEIELGDPRQQGKVVERLTKYDAFGLLGFATGMPRTTDAYAVRDTRLLMLPRDDYMSLLPTATELRELMARRIGGAEVATYLAERQGLTSEETSAWQAAALASLSTSGRFEPPRRKEKAPDDAVSLLKRGQRHNLFAGLSDETLDRISKRLISKTNPAGYTYFHREQAADRFYFLRQGTIHEVDPTDRSQQAIVVQPGSSFGTLSFLTQGRHSVTAVGQDQTQVLELRRGDFEVLLDEIPELRTHVSDYLKHHEVIDYVTRRHGLDAGKAARWIERAASSVERGKAFPLLSDMTRQVGAHEGAAIAMFLGIMLDGVPESLVVGAHAVTMGVSLSLVAALFLANLPEALSSAAGMKEQGIPRYRIMLMWTSLMVLTGIGAGLGAVTLHGASDGSFAVIEGVAVGAMLTMVAETMLPEAFHKGGGVVGLSTLAGFLATTFFSAFT